MQKKKKITHRCKELLEYNKNNYKPCSIRYEPWGWKQKPTWILSSLETDNECDTTFMFHSAKIKYCCFCGKKLTEVNNGNRKNN